MSDILEELLRFEEFDCERVVLSHDLNEEEVVASEDAQVTLVFPEDTWEMESLIVEFDLLLTSDLLGEYVEIDLENPVVDLKIIGVEEKFLKPRGIIGDVVDDPEVRVRVQ